MAKYTLYLDESETFKDGTRIFTIGGVILEDSKCEAITDDLRQLKEKIWDKDPGAATYVLHEKEITEANRSGIAKNAHNEIFRSNSKCNSVYAGLAHILKKHNITTIGVCVNKNRLSTLYSGEINSDLTIALQMLLENYCHFLMKNHAEGNLCYESIMEPQNQGLRQRFYELKAMGTLYYTSRFLQTHIGDIRFNKKEENLAGLQLADFIPNTLGRKACGNTAKHEEFKKIVLRQLYDGGLNMKPKYGFKIIP